MASSTTPQQQTLWDTITPFVFGGISGAFATSCVQPIDFLKVRIQTFGEQAGIKQSQIEARNPFSAAKLIYKKDGFLAFYKGLDAGITRQCVYATTRLGTFKTLSNKLTENGKILSGLETAIMSMFSGFVGAVVGNPFDLVLVRMQSDTTNPIEKRRNYSNVINALRRVPAEEGLSTLWRGFPSFAARAVATTCAQITTFERAKLWIMKTRGQEELNLSTRLM